jgi:hypothetical protein
MRSYLTLVLATLVAAPAAQGQFTPRVHSAFDRSFSALLGLNSYGTRFTSANATVKYKPSISVTVGGETPLTRRIGVLAFGSIAPLSKREIRYSGTSTSQVDLNIILLSADALLGWRFKPGAPVFFAAGGGFTFATKSLVDTSGSGGIEPQGTIGIGYDGAGRERAQGGNLRVLFLEHFVSPPTPTAVGVNAKALALDWSLSIGFRYVPGRRGADRTP